MVKSSKDDIDNNSDLPQVQHVQCIWDDEWAGGGREDMDDFINYEDEEEGTGAMDEEECEERCKERKKARMSMEKSHGFPIGACWY